MNLEELFMMLRKWKNNLGWNNARLDYNSNNITCGSYG